jgi:NADPH-dependent curcumin reductase CurA
MDAAPDRYEPGATLGSSARSRWAEGIGQMAAWLKEGTRKYREGIVEGFEGFHRIAEG